MLQLTNKLTLDHKFRDNAMKDCSIVIAVLTVRHEVLNLIKQNVSEVISISG